MPAPESPRVHRAKTRAATRLNPRLDKNLLAYVAAASTAGVSLLALVPPGQAKIVYKRAHKEIAPNNTIPLDLDSDGKADFRFHDSWAVSSFGEDFLGAITVKPVRSANQIWGYPARSANYASALSAGIAIGPKGKFAQGERVMAAGVSHGTSTYPGSCLGPWQNVRHRYLGLRFLIARKAHYGWARLNELCTDRGVNSAVLTGYAYETIPNKPIIAGKTHGKDDARHATLGALAAGASSIPMWRAKEHK